MHLKVVHYGQKKQKENLLPSETRLYWSFRELQYHWNCFNLRAECGSFLHNLHTCCSVGKKFE